MELQDESTVDSPPSAEPEPEPAPVADIPLPEPELEIEGHPIGIATGDVGREGRGPNVEEL